MKIVNKLQMYLPCLECKHFINDGKYTCKAFPKGIPRNILYDGVFHDHIIEGQTGNYLFQEKEKD